MFSIIVPTFNNLKYLQITLKSIIQNSKFNHDISTWDVSNVTQMKELFQDATSLNQDLRSWKLNEKLPKSRTMFTGATAFKIKEHSRHLRCSDCLLFSI